MAAVVFKSGVVALVASVRAYFAAMSVTAVVPPLGRKERTKQVNQGPGGANRVVFEMSDPAGKGGKLAAPHIVGARDIVDADKNVVATVRSLKNWERALTVSVWAADPSDTNDEEKQIEATEALFEWVLRATNAFVASGASPAASLVWGDTDWTSTPVERAYGFELRVGLVFKHPIFDVPIDLAFPSPALTKKLNQPQEAPCSPE